MKMTSEPWQKRASLSKVLARKYAVVLWGVICVLSVAISAHVPLAHSGADVALPLKPVRGFSLKSLTVPQYW